MSFEKLFSFEKLPGLPRDRVVAAIAPVLRAAGLRGVELVWKSDPQGRVLELTVEPGEGLGVLGGEAGGLRPAGERPGSGDGSGSHGGGGVDGSGVDGSGVGDGGGRGLTLDECADVSRAVSAALDAADFIEGQYRLEVGSPGLERPLYGLQDYERFVGKLAWLKLGRPVNHEYVLRGHLRGVDESGRVLVEVSRATVHGVPLENIRNAHLLIDWEQLGFAPKLPKPSKGRGDKRRPPSAGRRRAASGR